MGITTDPGYRLYVGNTYCFPPGKTPKKLYVTFSDIKIGTYWNPGYPNPKNGTFVTESYDSERWILNASDMYIEIFFGSIASGVKILVPGNIVMYDAWVQESCMFQGKNRIIYDGLDYYDGSHVITARD